MNIHNPENANVERLLQCAVFVMMAAIPVAATADEGRLDAAHERARDAAAALREMMQIEDPAVDYLLAGADAIAVIPNTTRGEFSIGGQGGLGLISTRRNGDWGPPLFVSIGGACVGFESDDESTDLVLVFTGKMGLAALVKDNVILGADVSVAAGRIGRNEEIDTGADLDAGIYSYSRSNGSFSGAALDGAVLQIADSENEKVYGEMIDVESVLAGRADLPTAETIRPFLIALREVVPAWQSTAGRAE